MFISTQIVNIFENISNLFLKNATWPYKKSKFIWAMLLGPLITHHFWAMLLGPIISIRQFGLSNIYQI